MKSHDYGWVPACIVGTSVLLLVACGGAEPSDASASGAQTTSAPVAQDGSDAAARPVVSASVKPDAELTAQTLAQAEIQAEQADPAQPLESLQPDSIASKEAYVSGAVVRKAAAVGIPAYRFYNASTGAHFYTISPSERDTVGSALSSPFSLEGAAFWVAGASSPGLSPVYRFFNAQTGVHFYTISEAERAKTVASSPQFAYEGVAYYASQVAGAGLVPFYRFYVPGKGFHFYTASESEKNRIQANQSATYSYEGIGYYVLEGGVEATASATGSLMPAVNSAKIPLGSTGTSLEQARFTGERPQPTPDGSGAFRTVCDYSHMAFDDPIVYPGQPGRSHLHTFFGNTGANANSTASSIANSGNSTCRGGILNRSSYWVPTVIDTRTGTPIAPKTSNFYYKTGAIRPSLIQPAPIGLRMIVGDSKRDTPGGMFIMNCNGNYDQFEGTAIPNCPTGAEVWQAIDFPQCWDGVNLDSPDHQSHMAFPVRNACPASHPVAIPAISFHLIYAVTASDDPSKWRLSSDNYTTNKPGGYSFHADWFNGWRQETMDAFVRNCDNPALDCDSHMLGDGRAIY